jgi:hypothetical protein
MKPMFLLKLKKNEEAIVKFEEAFEFATDPEAYYRYGNALSNVLKSRRIH